MGWWRDNPISNISRGCNFFSEKDFLWRISSATFTSTESNFSDFSGYQRYILPLEGKLRVYHEGLYSRELDKYEVEYFDGSWSTSSENTLDCRDYNFIVKKWKSCKDASSKGRR